MKPRELLPALCLIVLLALYGCERRPRPAMEAHAPAALRT